MFRKPFKLGLVCLAAFASACMHRLVAAFGVSALTATLSGIEPARTAEGLVPAERLARK